MATVMISYTDYLMAEKMEDDVVSRAYFSLKQESFFKHYFYIWDLWKLMTSHLKLIMTERAFLS